MKYNQCFGEVKILHGNCGTKINEFDEEISGEMRGIIRDNGSDGISELIYRKMEAKFDL